MPLTREQILGTPAQPQQPRKRVVPSQLEILARQLASIRDQADAAFGIAIGMLEAQAPQEEERSAMPPTFGARRPNADTNGETAP